jgi:hypothetical protein
MASKHTPDDQKLIDTLPLGVVMAFRSSVRDVSHAPDVNMASFAASMYLDL